MTNQTDSQQIPYPTLHFGGLSAESAGSAEITFRENRSPEPVAKISRAALLTGGLITFETFDDAGPLDVPVPLCSTKGVPIALCSRYRSATEPRALAVGRFSAYLSVVEAVGRERALLFGEHLSIIFNLFGSWGDPVLWAAVAEKTPLSLTPPELTAVATGAEDPREVGAPSRFCIEDPGGLKYVSGAAEAVQYVSMDDPERLGNPTDLLHELRGFAVGETLRGEYPTGGNGTEFTIRRLNTSEGHIRRVAPSLLERRGNVA
jgi:hypothetical protein